MNAFLGIPGGFDVSASIYPCTKGIFIWDVPIRVVSSDGETSLDVILMDTEGIGSFQRDRDHDTKILTLSLLLSSFFIYNSMTVIDEQSIDDISFIANISDNIQLSSHDDDNIARELPFFLWLLRDFSLEIADEEGNVLTPCQYLEYLLQDRNNARRDQIRHLFKSMFPRRSCYTLIRPVANEADLQSLSTLDESLIREEYIEQVRDLISTVFKRITPQTIAGHPVSPLAYLNIVKTYVNEINGGGIPSVQSALVNLGIYKKQKLLDDLQSEFRNTFASEYEKVQPINPDALWKLYDDISNQVRTSFLTELLDNNEQAMKYVKLLDDYMRETFDLFESHNIALLNSENEKDRESEEDRATLLIEKSRSEATDVQRELRKDKTRLNNELNERDRTISELRIAIADLEYLKKTNGYKIRRLEREVASLKSELGSVTVRSSKPHNHIFEKEEMIRMLYIEIDETQRQHHHIINEKNNEIRMLRNKLL